jgi:nucleoside-diphosphate-sugar epimerase
MARVGELGFPGQRDEDWRYTNLSTHLTRELPLAVSGSGENRVNLIHAGDVASAILTALEKEASGVFNIAGPSSPTIREVALTCIEVVGQGEIQTDSGPEATAPKTRFGLSYQAAQKVFGYSPAVDLKRGIRRMWTALKETHPESAVVASELGGGS